ncbi:WD40 repeat domain-containing protein [Streptomyces sp. NBC_00183]|uniref:WD40 repeat domain-containing protein n=1 Tax=Streptomyces sp. NBC_00183 TaxID=2903633 RepID=UPI00224D8925|nr:WD40 repeat domain-containing protein [Streptomyces sp. NBC_00183]MCX5289140.1 WD40 repeat domain-containing protein [Streptomyces sp. NBC_00183]
MNVDELVRDALREQAAEQTAARPGLADRVLALRSRRRNRRIATAAATVAVVAVAVAVPLLDSGKQDVRPSGVVDQDTVKSHPDQSRPRETISAKGTTLAAYYIPERVKKSKDTAVNQRVYYLLNPRSGRYEKTTKWSWIAVAPGMKTAAVLERDLPASRIGLLDLSSGKVERWIPVDHGVAGLAFSRDGRKLLATTYSENPDMLYKPQDGGGWGPKMGSSRTGFYVFDVASGKGSWAEVKIKSDPNDPMGAGFLINPRQDFALADDGRHAWAANPEGDIGKDFWDLTGKKVPVPAGDKYLSPYVEAGKSPNGKLVAGDFAGEGWKTASWLIDSVTGKKTKVRGQQLLAWVGNDQLVAWDIDKNVKNEFHNRLVLVTIGSNKEVPLSGFRQGNDGAAGRWEPVFAQP